LHDPLDGRACSRGGNQERRAVRAGVLGRLEPERGRRYEVGCDHISRPQDPLSPGSPIGRRRRPRRRDRGLWTTRPIELVNADDFTPRPPSRGRSQPPREIGPSPVRFGRPTSSTTSSGPTNITSVTFLKDPSVTEAPGRGEEASCRCSERCPKRSRGSSMNENGAATVPETTTGVGPIGPAGRHRRTLAIQEA